MTAKHQGIARPPAGGWELHLGDADYPALLAATPWPPAVLYGVGDRALLSAPSLGIVGSRRSTPYGRAAAERFAHWCAVHGVCVVSGAAIGCDQHAQRAAIAAGGSAIAVLAHGADLDYPARARDMLALLRRDGAVVSEQPWGSEPRTWMFRTRNRIIAGLSVALLVVEARIPSGTFSTADYAIEANRDVLAVPGSIFAPECRGPNRLIRDGAFAVTDATDLRLMLQSAVPHLQSGEPIESADTMPDERCLVAQALLADPMRPDDVAWALSMDVVDVIRHVARLESEGVVHRYADGRYGPG